MSDTTSPEAGMATPPSDSDDEVLLECLAMTRFQYDNITKETFDKQGDLYLLVGPNGTLDQALYTVCSRALSRTSSVFDAMLRSLKEERFPEDGDWIVRLPRDDSESIRVILNIAHGRFRDVPKFMSLETLHQLCVCLEKYRIAECLGPWAKTWCEAAQSSNRKTVEGNARIAWVSWVLGNRDLLERSIRFLLWNSKPSSLVTTKAGNEYLVHLDSTGILDKIRTIPIAKMQLFVSWLQGIWTQRASECNPSSLCRSVPDWTAATADRAACSAAILGSLTASLYQKGMLPSSQSISYNEFTLSSFVKVAKGIAEETVGRKCHGLVSHDDCGLSASILEQIEMQKKDMGSVLTSLNIEHLEERARQIGVEY